MPTGRSNDKWDLERPEIFRFGVTSLKNSVPQMLREKGIARCPSDEQSGTEVAKNSATFCERKALLTTQNVTRGARKWQGKSNRSDFRFSGSLWSFFARD
jgi:hypothetical protein